MSDDRRPPGVGSQPPDSWPAARIPGAVPGRSVGAPRRSALVGFVAFLVGALVVGAAFATYAFGDRRGRDAGATAATTIPSDRPASLNIRSILDRVEPSVVSIEAGKADGSSGGAGSGVVISDDGLIITNAHVLREGSDSIVVRFSDGTRVAADVVGTLPDQDIALLMARRTELTAAVLGSSANLRVGDDVVAIGNALNLGGDPSVTRGIVSAKDRAISTGGLSLKHLIQTDAAINPGNSGGPLINASGEVVGINTAIVAGAQNLGFAIAIDAVKDLLPSLQAQANLPENQRGVFGAATLSLSSPRISQQTRDDLAIAATEGVFINAVRPDTAAAKAGLRQGDVIVEIDGLAISDQADLDRTLAGRRPGDVLVFTIERRGVRQQVTVTLGSS